MVVIDLKLIVSILSYPIQLGWKKLGKVFRGEESEPIKLGDLSTAKLYEVQLAPGIVKADRETLNSILFILPSETMAWVNTHDFGDSFRRTDISPLWDFPWSQNGPEHEFLDRALEQMRKQLIEAVDTFLHTSSSYVAPNGNDFYKIPNALFGGNESLFWKRREEINVAARQAWERYCELIRRAREKLALSEFYEEEPGAPGSRS